MRFEADGGWAIEVIDANPAIQNLGRGFYGVAKNSTTGEVRDTRKKRVNFKTQAECAEFMKGAFPSMRRVKASSAAREAEDRARFQEMIDADDLPIGLRGRAKQLGLAKAAPAAPAAVEPGGISPEKWAVPQQWSVIPGSPQKNDLDEKYPEQQKIITENVRLYLLAHKELVNITFADCDRMYQTLNMMGCWQKNRVVHRRTGPDYGGRAYVYNPANDPTLKPAARKFSEAEILAASRRLPQATSLTEESVTQFLGDPELAKAVATYWRGRRV